LQLRDWVVDEVLAQGPGRFLVPVLRVQIAVLAADAPKGFQHVDLEGNVATSLCNTMPLLTHLHSQFATHWMPALWAIHVRENTARQIAIHDATSVADLIRDLAPVAWRFNQGFVFART
jgi:hypothetical protein